MRSTPELDRLSAQDVSNLRIEARGVPMHVAALAILEGAPLCDAEGRLRLESVRDEIERHLHLAPRLRQVVHRPPPGHGRPFWVDDPVFDIRAHVREQRVPPPGDEEALMGICEGLDGPALDPSRPPWELWFLTGLADGRVGMLIRLHHVVADGIASVALLGALFEDSPDAAVPSAPQWFPVPIPSSRDILIDNLRSRGRSLDNAISWLAHPMPGLRRLGAIPVSLREVFGEGAAPRSSLNVPVGMRRRLLLARADLDRAKDAAHAHGASVNDVLLAAVAGGTRELLLGRGELTPGLRLRTSVPVSVRTSRDRPDAGNLVALMIVPLPVADSDPVRLLEAIARETASRKRHPHVMGPLPGSMLVQRALIGLMNRQRMVNLFTSNVPGPKDPLYFAGARVLEVFQIGVVQGNVTLSVGMLSYAGQLNVDIVADADVNPDLDVFADGLRNTLAALGAAPVVVAT